MNITINDILRGTKAKDVPVTSIYTTRISQRIAQPISVQYYFDILKANDPQPIDSQILSIKQTYESSEDDIYLPYPVDDMNEAVDLCKKLCQQFGIPFTADNERDLRGKTNSNRIYLLVIERITYSV